MPSRSQRVSAVCQAPHSGDLFVGFESGELFCYHPASGALVAVGDLHSPILSLATNNWGNQVLALHGESSHGIVLSSFALPAATGHLMCSVPILECGAKPWLCLLALTLQGHEFVAVWTGAKTLILQGTENPLPILQVTHEGLDEEPIAGLLLRWPDTREGRLGLLYCTAHWIGCWGLNRSVQNASLLARDSRALLLGHSERSTLHGAALAWLLKGRDGLEVAGLSDDGMLLSWAELELHGDGLITLTEAFPRSVSAPFLCAQIIRSGLVVVLTEEKIQWLRKGDGLVVVREKAHPLPRAVACFPYYHGNELLIVSADGYLERHPGLSWTSGSVGPR
jgi:hypothetical protein